MLVDVEEVLRFFDERPSGSRGHATALVAVAGEDLGVGLFCHYLHRRDLRAEPLEVPCTTGNRVGSRLDRWIRVSGATGKTLYQVEVKNWSAHAIGGVPLPLNASSEDVAKYKMDHWQNLWDQSSGTFSPPTLKKVLEQMRPPEACDLHQPLVCYWSAMHPTGDDEPFFSEPTPSRWCAMVWVFSVSAYLRNLRAAGERRVDIEMPQAKARMKWLQQLFPAS